MKKTSPAAAPQEFSWDPELLTSSPISGGFKITANNLTYTHIPKTESFYLTDPSRPVTTLKVIKDIAPTIFKSKYKDITPPEKFYNFGDSTRAKIIKAFQAHTDLPRPCAATNQFVPYFDILSSTVGGTEWAIQQQYSAAYWACNQDHSAATSLFLYYGFSPRFEQRMGGASMHKISITPDGILIDQSYTHTFQERLEAACLAAHQVFQDCLRRNSGFSIEFLQEAAFTEFFYHKKKYISVDSDYSQEAKAKICNYIGSLAAAPPLPSINEPTHLLDDDLILLKWEDFGIADSSAAHRQRANNNLCAAALLAEEKLRDMPRETLLPRSAFPSCVNDHNYATWKKMGILKSPKRGFYTIAADFHNLEK